MSKMKKVCEQYCKKNKVIRKITYPTMLVEDVTQNVTQDVTQFRQNC